jgi:phage protein D
MLTPAYKLTIGNKSVDSVRQPEASTAVGLVVSLDMEMPLDSFTVVLGQVDGLLKPALHDKATVELGYADNGGLAQVIAGTVTSVQSDLDTLRVVGYTAAETLLRSYSDQTYESRTAGAIVQDLAAKAKVPVANADDGIHFPTYVIQKFVTGAPVRIFEHARDILEVQATHSPPLAGTVQAWGESPTDSKGAGVSAWLRKNFRCSKGIAGSGKPVLLLERPALRTGEAAKTAALADETRIQRSPLNGRLLSVVRPEVQLGDVIQLRVVPDASLNKTFQVRTISHRITKRGGFTTEIGFRSIQRTTALS